MEEKTLLEIELNLESFSKDTYICALYPPLVPCPLERDNNSVPGTSCQF